MRHMIGRLSLLLAVAPVSAQHLFVDVASDVNLNFTAEAGPTFEGIPLPIMQAQMGHGAAVGDYDDDGDYDIYLLAGLDTPNRLFRNELSQGSLSFTDVTTMAGVGDLGIGRLAHFADLNGDDLLDLLVISDGNPFLEVSGTRIFRNDGDGTFTDMTIGSELFAPGWLRCGASLADYDSDGDLDVYITNWSASVGGSPAYLGRNVLFRNEGGFVFSEQTFQEGLLGLARDSFTAIFTDFDEDADADLFVALDHTEDVFYRREPTGFVDGSIDANLVHTGNDMGVTCADVDNDGDLDLYATNITDGVPPCGAGTTQGNSLHINQLAQTGELSFADKAFEQGVFDTHWGWGTEFVDVDNDADLDLMCVTGFDEFLVWSDNEDCAILDTPSVLFVNNGAGAFTRGDPDGLLDDSRALIMFDYDRDGDMDALVTNMGEPVRLLENTSPSGSSWIDVQLRQRAGLNGRGIGARIEVRTGTTTQMQVLLAGESYLAGTPAEAHFGTGDAETVDMLRVHWTDGTTTTLTDIATPNLAIISQPMCPCDANDDATIDVTDLLVYLESWFASDLRADYNADDSVGIGDLLEMLSCWLGGC